MFALSKIKQISAKHSQVLFLEVLLAHDIRGFSGRLSGKESACQRSRSRRCSFGPWVGKIPWSRKQQPTPVLLPGTFHGQGSLAGYSPWGCKESDMTEHARKDDLSKF